MNIAAIQSFCFNPYNSSTVEIYVSGCSRQCVGCCNPELQDFNYGKELDVKNLLDYLDKRKDLFENISFVGGDLLCQDLQIAQCLIETIKTWFPNKQLWLFTGATQEELPQWTKELFDYIKVGKYDETLKQDGFPASSNQKLLKKGLDF